MKFGRFIISTWVVSIALVAGCSSLPTYPPMSDAEALATIADRLALIVTVSAECDLALADDRGQRVNLEGVLLAEPPGRLRLRAWKLGRAVFDLTVVDGKAWLMALDEGPNARGPAGEAPPARRVSQAFDLLGPLFFRCAHAAGGDGVTLVARGSALGRGDVVCEIERLTLTPRRFVVPGREGSAPSTLRLDEYEVVGSTVWPMRWHLQGATGEIVVRVRELELNGRLPAEAFTPPARAGALP